MNLLLFSANRIFAQSSNLFYAPEIKEEKVQYKIIYNETDKHYFELHEIKKKKDLWEISVTGLNKKGEYIRSIYKFQLPRLKPIYSYYLKTSKKDGKILEKYSAEYKNKRVKFLSINENKIIILPDDTYIGLEYVLRGFPFKTKKEVNFHIFYYKPDFVEFYAKIKNIEKISVPAGKFSCYKIEVGATGILKMLVPKFYYWYTTEEPYRLIKFSGKERPFGDKRTGIAINIK